MLDAAHARLQVHTNAARAAAAFHAAAAAPVRQQGDMLRAVDALAAAVAPDEQAARLARLRARAGAGTAADDAAARQQQERIAAARRNFIERVAQLAALQVAHAQAAQGADRTRRASRRQ
jgi:hypothetical protein